MKVCEMHRSLGSCSTASVDYVRNCFDHWSLAMNIVGKF